LILLFFLFEKHVNVSVNVLRIRSPSFKVFLRRIKALSQPKFQDLVFFSHFEIGNAQVDEKRRESGEIEVVTPCPLTYRADPPPLSVDQHETLLSLFKMGGCSGNSPISSAFLTLDEWNGERYWDRALGPLLRVFRRRTAEVSME